MFSPAHFEPTKAAETDRGLGNITHLRGIWLDNDGGDLDHAEFAALFPYLRVVAWNTASSTPEEPRWRAFIPTDCALSIEVQMMGKPARRPRERPPTASLRHWLAICPGSRW
ncbi:hypothetical protein VQ02_32395 [Methylobacterium variabile]|uniref:Uncharacterized protein n=1 Tax=Methylobacterium variabile TaxID=298794 RepID=A0A0J6S2X5_9HYPH|nr:hypothetical protein VQ02_32395 [Methylobacterium variabile]